MAARALLDDPRRGAEAVAAAMRSHGGVPGFGHFLYPDGDPRAELVLATLWRRHAGTARLRRRVEELSDVVAALRVCCPTSTSRARQQSCARLGLPAAAGEVVFQVARSHRAHRARARGVRRGAAPVARQEATG